MFHLLFLHGHFLSARGGRKIDLHPLRSAVGVFQVDVIEPDTLAEGHITHYLPDEHLSIIFYRANTLEVDSVVSLELVPGRIADTVNIGEIQSVVVDDLPAAVIT